MSLNTPKRIRTLASYGNTPPVSDNSATTASPYQNNSSGQWADGSLSPISSCGSPEFSVRQGHNSSSHNSSLTNSLDNKESKRGRPRSECLTTLMMEGSTSPSAIKCTFCNRVFPREKSLQAHLRTHTGEIQWWINFTVSQDLKENRKIRRRLKAIMKFWRKSSCARVCVMFCSVYS